MQSSVKTRILTAHDKNDLKYKLHCVPIKVIPDFKMLLFQQDLVYLSASLTIVTAM